MPNGAPPHFFENNWLAALGFLAKFRLAMPENFTDHGLIPFEFQQAAPLRDATANPFKLVVDPAMRVRLRKAIFDLIENHDACLAEYVSNGNLSLDSYKEYVELFAKSLHDSMGTQEGVKFLLDSCGFDVEAEDINLKPEIRWKGRS